jgi:hypothetical protein
VQVIDVTPFPFQRNPRFYLPAPVFSERQSPSSGHRVKRLQSIPRSRFSTTMSYLAIPLSPCMIPGIILLPAAEMAHVSGRRAARFLMSLREPAVFLPPGMGHGRWPGQRQALPRASPRAGELLVVGGLDGP